MKTAYTLRGQITEGVKERLVMDDGRLNHGFRVKSFIIVSDPGTSGTDCQAVLSLSGETGAQWNWASNDQIAWTSTTVRDVSGVLTPFTLVDPNNVVIRDLFIEGVVSGSGGTGVINYFIELEPITLDENETIMALIRERSQGVLRP